MQKLKRNNVHVLLLSVFCWLGVISSSLTDFKKEKVSKLLNTPCRLHEFFDFFFRIKKPECAEIKYLRWAEGLK